MEWQAGTLTVPSSTGSQAITGLGGTPRAVFFFGTNWLAEDTAVTTNYTGIFRGMAAPKYDAPGTIVQHGNFASPAGLTFNSFTRPILTLDTSGALTNQYHAGVTSFDVDGFTLDWIVAAAGGYKVVYVALMDVAEIGAYFGASTTVPLGFKAGSAMLQGHRSQGGPTGAAVDRTQVWYGSAAYTPIDTYGAGLTAYGFPAASAQSLNDIYNFAPHIAVAQNATFIGAFLSPGNVTATLTGVGNESLSFAMPTADHYGMVAAWDDEDSQTGRLTPAASEAGVATVSGLPFAPGLVISYTISNEPSGQSNNAIDPTFAPRGAIGFSVATPDFQWSAVVDGKNARGAFQSFQRGFADVVSGTSVHAGTVALTADGFVLTTEEDDVAADNLVWHAFGHPPLKAVWIPQIYRRIVNV